MSPGTNQVVNLGGNALGNTVVVASHAINRAGEAQWRGKGREG